MMDVKDFIMNRFIIRWREISLYGRNAENAELSMSFMDILLFHYQTLKEIKIYIMQRIKNLSRIKKKINK